MGEVSLILGMTITRHYDPGNLSITQNGYTESSFEKFGMDGCNAVHTPEYASECLKGHLEEALLNATATQLYQTIVGSMLYRLQCTRYKMCYSVTQLTRACRKLPQVQMTAAKPALILLLQQNIPLICRSITRRGSFGRMDIPTLPLQPILAFPNRFLVQSSF